VSDVNALLAEYQQREKERRARKAASQARFREKLKAKAGS
jgi:hypothetical protein